MIKAALPSLRPGMVVYHSDTSPNGYYEGGIARVVRARGRGVLLERRGLRFRISRDDVVRVLPNPPDEKDW